MVDQVIKPRPSTGQQYKIKEAVVFADRLGGDGENGFTVDVSQQIQELSLYESLEKSYVTGQLLLVDDNAVFDSINFKGTEKLAITILSVNSGGDDISFPVSGRKIFIMTNIEKQQRTGDKTTIYLFNLIEEYAFVDANLKLSKAYRGKVEDIIATILTSELKVDADYSYSTESYQEPIKVTVPYMTPLQACEWLRRRITSINGSPFFLYSSIHDDRVRLGNLDTMLKQKPFNKLPYRYSRAATADATEKDELARAFTVNSINFENMENTLRLIRNGALGASISSTNLNDGITTSSKYKVRNTLDRLRTEGVIDINAQQNVFDPLHKVIQDDENPSYIDDLNSVVFHELTSPRTYLEYNNYHDTFGPAETRKKIESYSIAQLLYRNMIDVDVPGTAFIIGRVSVGDIARIEFLKSDVTGKAKSDEEYYDKNRSGNYLIHSVRHTFRDTVHNVTMSVTKLSERPKALEQSAETIL